MEIDSTTLNTFLTALSALILAIIAWYNKQRTDSAVQTAAATQSTALSNAQMATAEKFDPGFTVLPTSPELKSGQSVALRVQTGLATKHLVIDWNDGSTPQEIPLLAGSATAIHTYTFTPDGKYTGHTFFPVFTISDDAGHWKSFNNVSIGQGACCAVYVTG